MKKNILHIFYYALAALLCLSSCALEEPVGTHQNSDGYVEFVARPTSYNKYDVATKAGEPDPIEDVAYNAFLLIFDNEGQLILRKQVIPSGETTSTTAPATTIPKDKGLSTVTACYLINVPHSFVNGIEALAMPEDATDEYKATNYNKYINTAVLEGITYKTGTPMGVPLIDVDNNSTTAAVPCIPMFGMANVNLHGETTSIQIPIKRLFAKISIDLKMSIKNPGIGQIAPSTVNYKLSNYLLHYIPKKVCLVEADGESAWVKDKSSFAGVDTSPLTSGPVDFTAINNDSESSIQFEFYAPEYHLAPKAVTNKPQDKPKNFDDKKYPIYLELVGILNRSLVDNTELNYKIYLGGDSHSDFSLSRNHHYKNNLIIYGLDKNDKGEGDNLDWRVSTSLVNNPVAQNGQSANCYVIGKTGEYTIPAYKGAYTNLNSAPLCLAGKTYVETRVNVALNKSETIGINQISFDANPAYDPETNTISFSIAQLDLSILGSLDYVPNGNFVLELQYKESADGPWITEWSWHFWCLNAVNILGTGWGQVGEQKMPDGTTNIHDRNIGVVNGTPIGAQSGFYYKYGDHTPYIDTNSDDVYEKIGGGSLGTSSWTPINGVKSPTDPCPPRYRVPSSDLWGTETKNYTDATKEHATIGVNRYAFIYYESNNGTQWNLTDDYTIYFPYAGWFDSSFKPQTGVSDEGGDEQNYTKTIDVKYNYTSLGTTNLWSRVSTPSQFRNISWQRVDESVEGRIWRNDGQALRFGYEYEGIKINSFERRTGKWKNSYSSTVNWNDDWTTVTDPSTLSNTEKTALVKELDGNIFDKIDWSDIMGSLQKIFGSPEVMFEPVAGDSNGYQVRCVVDTQQ